MNTYKKNRVYIGSSDIAALVAVGARLGGGVRPEMIRFGGDGDYSAYIVDGEQPIPEHYKREYLFIGWLKIYDDSGLSYKVYGREIHIYRAGSYGLIIKVYKEEAEQ